MQSLPARRFNLVSLCWHSAAYRVLNKSEDDVNHLQKYLVDEFVEDYCEGHLSRREAIRRLAGIVGAAAAAQLIAACGPAAQPTGESAPTADTPAAPTSRPTADTAAAPTVAATADAPTAAPADATAAPSPAADTSTPPNSVAVDDPRISAEAITFPGADGQLSGYLARPAAEGTFPIVLVCHENRGLTPHIEDVTRRVAAAGYVGLAVDLLSREGGTAQIADADAVPGLLSGAPPERHVQDFTSGLEYVKAQPYAQPDRVGMVGFCFGGGVTWLVAAALPELRAAVPFYGPPPPEPQLAQVQAPVLAIYAERDQRINQSIPAVEAALQARGATYQKIIYPGVDHAFHNDTGQRYNATAAQEAWAATLAWFEQHLSV
jgi:carboxymethylenebutenolidase